MRQLVALKNFVDGNEISFSFIDNESHDKVTRNGEFPSGYYFLMAPLTLLSSDLLTIHRIAELVGIVLVIYQLFLLGNWIGRKIDRPLFAYYSLLFSLIQLNPWRASGFTDIWSLLLFITALRIAIAKPLSTRNSFFIALLSFTTCWMRYAYYPLAFVAPIILIVRHEKFSLKSTFSAILTLGLIGLMNILHNSYFKNQTHLESHFTQKRFFWPHASQVDPLPFNALFSDHVIMNFLGYDRWGENTDWNAKYLILFCAFLILGIVVWSSRSSLINLYSKSVFKSRLVFRQPIILLTLGIGLTIVFNWGSITTLSIYYPSFKSGYIYTWSLISRYFAPSYLLLQLFLLTLLYSLRQSKLKSLLRILVISSIVFQSSYWLSFTSRFSMSDTWANYEKFYGRMEMKKVIARTRESEKSFASIPEDQLTFEYLSIYYITNPKALVNYLRTQESLNQSK